MDQQIVSSFELEPKSQLTSWHDGIGKVIRAKDTLARWNKFLGHAYSIFVPHVLFNALLFWNWLVNFQYVLCFGIPGICKYKVNDFERDLAHCYCALIGMNMAVLIYAYANSGQNISYSNSSILNPYRDVWRVILSDHQLCTAISTSFIYDLSPDKRHMVGYNR